MRQVEMLVAVIVMTGCPVGPTPGEATETGGTTGTTSPGEMTTTSGSEPSTTPTGVTPTSSGTSTGGAPACGDGTVDAGEACDDGNTVEGDGCNNDCQESARLLWQNLSQRRGADVYLDVEAAPDGTLLISGQRSPDGTQDDRWLVRFDLDGNMLWERSYDGSATSEAIFAVAQRDDAVFAAGSTWSDADAWDLWVGRLDLAGEVVWEETLSSGFGGDFATGLVMTAAGDVVVTGEVSEGPGEVSVWTRLYAPDGAVKWTRAEPVLHKTTYYFGPAVAVAADDTLRVGFASDTDTLHELLLAYPADGGEPLWQQGETPDGLISGVALLGADVVTTGERYKGKFFVRRVAEGGASLWETQDCVGEAGRAVAVDGQGDVIAIGYGPGQTATNIRLCKFSGEGVLRWGKDLDGQFGHDLGHAVTVLADGRIVAAGVMAGEGEDPDAWLAMFAP
ncbi:DUF4215 domain-containing protein [Nannocystis sp. SCPEA4]|uniref:DUF4215 domain-containing protein n=1 Tax=Nannocystis sp. SCPEA4 TaxID=2996787 RepID=UPI00226E6979|nr:DUF4215 domain-containing protein [Nannocystis sp. SCPEA4]MCY1062752.1 DUF4215 domain-containing protein [Nannocystis sp. SCPEA4]